MLEAFPLADTRAHVLDMIARKNLVAMDGARVAGGATSPAIPLLPTSIAAAWRWAARSRGLGLGRRLIDAALEQARAQKFLRVELSIHA